jgi:hypothetical protein
MPILKPEIAAALRESGLLGEQTQSGVPESLDRAGLGLDPTLEVVEGLMQRGGSEVVRLRAAELSLKARGLMKDQAAPLPSITIVINDPLSKGGLNPILLPRELPA